MLLFFAVISQPKPHLHPSKMTITAHRVITAEDSVLYAQLTDWAPSPMMVSLETVDREGGGGEGEVEGVGEGAVE